MLGFSNQSLSGGLDSGLPSSFMLSSITSISIHEVQPSDMHHIEAPDKINTLNKDLSDHVKLLIETKQEWTTQEIRLFYNKMIQCAVPKIKTLSITIRDKANIAFLFRNDLKEACRDASPESREYAKKFNKERNQKMHYTFFEMVDMKRKKLGSMKWFGSVSDEEDAEMGLENWMEAISNMWTFMMSNLFDDFDVDGSGYLDSEEYDMMTRKLNYIGSFEAFDKNHDDKISREEFDEFLEGKHEEVGQKMYGNMNEDGYESHLC